MLNSRVCWQWQTLPVLLLIVVVEKRVSMLDVMLGDYDIGFHGGVSTAVV